MKCDRSNAGVFFLIVRERSCEDPPEETEDLVNPKSCLMLIEPRPNCININSIHSPTRTTVFMVHIFEENLKRTCPEPENPNLTTSNAGQQLTNLDDAQRSHCLQYEQELYNVRPIVEKFTSFCMALDARFQEMKKRMADVSYPAAMHLREIFRAELSEFINLLNEIAMKFGVNVIKFTSEVLNGEESARLNFEIGQFVSSACKIWLKGSRFAWRSLIKPRGYAGDFEMIQMMYDRTAADDGNMSFIGSCIDETLLGSIPVRSVRKRCKFIREMIWHRLKADETIAKIPNIMSIGCGPCRELLEVMEQYSTTTSSQSSSPVTRFFGLDIDQEALDHTEKKISQLPQDKIQNFEVVLHRTNVLRVVQSHATDMSLRPQDAELLEPLRGDLDIVYSLGLIDYFGDDEVVALLDWIYDLLRPDGGTAVIGNFSPNNPLRGWMDFVLDWRLMYRTEDELLNLCRRSKCGAGCEFSVNSVDDEGVQLFLTIHRI